MDSAPRIKQEPNIESAFIEKGKNLIGTVPMEATVKTERLQTFRGPRDLTLANGRTTKPPANKKVYTPNLNAVRNKNTDVKTASTGPKSRVKTDRNKNDKDTRNKKAAMIQTSGIFSDGLAQRVLTRASKSDKSSSSKEPGESIRKPMFSRTDTKINLEVEHKLIQNLYNDNDEDLAELEQKIENGLKLPIKLENSDYKIKPPEVKTENLAEPKQDPVNSVENVLSGEQHNKMFLLQLPDALPGKCDAADKGATAPNGGSDCKSEATVNDEDTPQYCTVRDLAEGYIGKLIRYRSGKVKLMLGDIMFDINLGMDTGFLQELVSINTNQVERNGNIINIGTINAKLNASPDWEYLFKNST
ncbi:DNA-directed RNA polymerase III subunit RPC4 [Anopheles maculipalpis]|uniref:DNA-directed RNA polymerase III subunit RPC4 n=1 Tax=Anopheles maculipalpis TaxID=1496333 RepID=UPI0021599EA8|nr:DNA-directed RNA polymerase III subunit RPC4 [Anopheles maculipalpis]